MDAMLMAAGLSMTHSIGQFLQAGQKTLAYYGSIIISIIGVAMVIVGIYQIAKNLISHGKGQTNWIVTFALIIVGGAFAVTGGWSMIGNWSKSNQSTLDNMAQGTADDTAGDVEDPFGN